MSSIPKEQLVAELQRVSEMVDQPPRAKDMDEYGKFSISAYVRKFGRWNDALKAAGLGINHESVESAGGKEALLKDLRGMRRVLGRAPRQSDVVKMGRFSDMTYYNHFGTYTNALLEADIEPFKHPGKRITQTCEICGDGFKVTPSNTERRFCGMECFAEHRRGKYTESDHPRWKERVERECHYCSEGMEVAPWYSEKFERVYCSDNCRFTAISEQYDGDGRFEYGEGWNEEKRETVREKYDKECQSCGIAQEKVVQITGRKLSVHHIRPAKEFDNPERRNAVDNLVPLCNTCHQKWEGIPLRPSLVGE
jgi:hypothetical protein